MSIARDPTSPESLAAMADYLDSLEPRSKTRGKEYFKAGRVVDFDVAGPEVRGVVRGTYDYDVLLSCAEGPWFSMCSCPIGEDCKHAYAVGHAWLRRHDGPREKSTTSSPAPMVAVGALRLQPGEERLVSGFMAAAGHAPDSRQLSWLRNLASLQYSLRHSYNSHGWFDQQALQNLVPAAARHRLPHDYRNPLDGWWTVPPATPMDLWPFVALYFTECGIPLPDFAVPIARLDQARAARAAAQIESAVKAWRHRFATLDELAANTPLPRPRQALRLRLGRKKWTWEISPAGADGAYRPLSADTMRELLSRPADCAVTLDDAGNAFLAYLRANFQHRGRTTLAAKDDEDRALLGSLLGHPATRPRIVAEDGRPLTDDPRRITWQINDHPTDPDLVTVRLVLADGSAPPGPLLHVPANPTLYISADASIFAGLPPPSQPAKPLHADFGTDMPRAALALPEAGRFAARTGVTVPGSTAGRFRPEPLRARIRAELGPRSPGYGGSDEVLVVELHGLASDGAPRVRWQDGAWSTSTPELVRPADAAFLLHNYGPLQPAADHLHGMPGLWWVPSGSGPNRCIREVTDSSFPNEFAAWLAAMPAGVIVDLGPELAAFAGPPTRAQFALEIEQSAIDWFDVRVTLRVEDTTLTPAEIALLRKARGRFIRLAGRGWRRLDITSDEATNDRLERLGLEAATLVDDPAREAQKFHALQLADEALGEVLPAKFARQIRERAAAIRSLPAPDLPAGLRAELRPYQVEGFHFLAHLAANRFGGVLADDMGLGKTLEALAWLLWVAAQKQVEGRSLRALVVCPKSVVFNWESETARFAPSLATGRLAPRSALPVPKDVHLVVVNYAQLRLNADALAAVKWDAVILDEGQNIKNPASASARAARALPAAHRLVLTGTPVENRLLDLWSLFAFAQPGLLGGQASFKRLYHDREQPAAAHARLAARVRHFLLRRTKAQVARDLPERTEEDVVVELDGPQRALYDAELKRTRQMLLRVESSRDFDAQRFNILQSLLRLRQICCDPRLLGAELKSSRPSGAKKVSGNAAAGDKEPAAAASAKLDALMDTIEPLVAEGHRVLVFSQFVTMLELIRTELVARDIRHLLLTGQTENRRELVEQFQAADGPPVFLLSLKAAGAGLNLTAASYVVLYDPWWNPAVEAQAIDRTHRIGQTSRVIAYRLLARNTVEEKIRALQKEKAALAAAVVHEESLARVLDLDSLRRILA